MLLLLIKGIIISSCIFLIYLLCYKSQPNKKHKTLYMLDNRLKNQDDIFSTEHLSNKDKFNAILDSAIKILDDTISQPYEPKLKKYQEHPIFDFIRILGRSLQSDYIKYSLYFSSDECNVPNLYWNTVGFDTGVRFAVDYNKTISFWDLLKEVSSNKELSLSTDLILPWPWKKSRLINAIESIGNGRLKGVWRQDPNHCIELWLPIGLGWVTCGNHSIAIGIIQGGKIKPHTFYDMSSLYKYIRCDGEYFIKNDFNTTDEIIGNVTSVEFAAIFEIGRLLIEKNISFID